MSETVIVVESITPQVSVSMSNDQGPQGIQGLPGLVPVFSRQNELSVVTGQTRFYFEEARTITKIRASVGVAPTGAAVVVVVYVNGTSIGTLSIAAGSNTTTLTVSKEVTAGDYATVSITGIGSTYPGSNLTVSLTIN